MAGGHTLGITLVHHGTHMVWYNIHKVWYWLSIRPEHANNAELLPMMVCHLISQVSHGEKLNILCFHVLL